MPNPAISLISMSGPYMAVCLRTSYPSTLNLILICLPPGLIISCLYTAPGNQIQVAHILTLFQLTGVLIDFMHSLPPFVSGCSSTALQPVLDTFPRQKTALTSNTGTTPTMEEAKPDGVSTLRNSFRQYNVSPEVTDIILASWRSGTQKRYKVYLEKWILLS